MTLFATLLALIAFGPAQTMAKEPGGSGGGNANHPTGVHPGSGNQGGDHHPGVGSPAGVNLGAQPNTGGAGGLEKRSQQSFDANHRPDFSGGPEGRDSWRYRWDNGRWLFWGPDNRWMWYGDDGRWLNYGTPYVVQRPILQNFSGGPIKIVNPAKTGASLSYLLNDSTFTIPPGSSQDFQEDRSWVIQFSRGANLDQARYGLQSGLYTFARTEHGWELYRTEFPQTAAPPPPAAPANPR
ncbi:MAG: hypothetical protein ABR915_22385 [Thermoguttaceae bacterium]|jgi:hypothetical protein